jgi:glycopeptide antibiotics resistance protein
MWWKLWLVWIVIVVGLTTMPWKNYVGHSHWRLVHWVPFQQPLVLTDVLSNVALFTPFGYLLRRAAPSWSAKWMWIATVLAAAALSSSVELFQVYCHNRDPSTTDICSNLIGSVFGIMLAHRIVKFRP